MSERCIVCDGAVVGPNFRWDGNSQHPESAACMAHLKWKAEQAERKLTETQRALAEAKTAYSTMMGRYEAQAAEQTQQIHADHDEITTLRDTQAKLEKSLAAACDREIVGDHERDKLRATLARVEALKNDAILRFDEIDRECEALTAERDGLRRSLLIAGDEADGLRAAIEQAIEDGYNNLAPATWDQMQAALGRGKENGNEHGVRFPNRDPLLDRDCDGDLGE